MSASSIRRALSLGSRRVATWSFRDCRGKRQTVVGKAVSVQATYRGVTITLDTGKRVVVRCSRQTVCELFGLA